MLKKLPLTFLSILISIFVSILIFIYLFLWIFILPLKPYIENYLSKTLNLKTEFQSISYSFPFGLSLKKVVISDDKNPILTSQEVTFVISPISYLKRRESFKYIKLNSPTIFIDNIRFTNGRTRQFALVIPKIKWDNGTLILKNKTIKCDGKISQKNGIISASLFVSPGIPLSAEVMLKNDAWIVDFFSSCKRFNLRGEILGRTDPRREIFINSIGEYNNYGITLKATLNGKIESIAPLILIANIDVEGKISKVPVTLSGGLKYEDKNIKFDDVLISADRFKITCSGSYDGERFYAKFLPIGEKHPIALVDYSYPILKIINLRKKESLLCEFFETYDKKLLKIKGRIADFDTEGSVSVNTDGIYEFLCNLSKKGLSVKFKGGKYKNELEFRSKIQGLFKNLKTILCLSGSLKYQDKRVLGEIHLSTFSLNGFEIKPIVCNLNYYDKKLIKDITSENISGNIVVDIDNETLSGKIKYLLDVLSGKIDGTALISGKITAPKIVLDYRLENIRHNNLTLSLSGKAEILNGRLVNKIQGTGSVLDVIKANIKGENEIPNLTKLNKMNGNIKLTSIRPESIKLDNITFNFFTDDKNIYLENIKIKAPKVDITSKGRLHRNKLNLQMKINNFELPYLSLYGVVEVSCNFLQPETIQGLITLNDFWVNQYCIPKYEFSCRSYKNKLVFHDKDKNLEILLEEKRKGEKILTCMMKKKDMNFNFNSSIVKGIWSGEFHCSGLDFQHIVSLIGLKIPASGKTNFSGSLKYREGTLLLKMDSFVKQLLINELLLGDAHLNLNYEKDKFKIETLTITDKDVEIKASGVIPVGKDKQVDFIFSIPKFPLHKFKNLSELIEQIDGVINGEIRVTGKSDEPLLYGDLNITNGSIKFVKYIDTLKSISGNIRFEGENGFINILSVSDNETKVLIKGDMKFKKLKLEDCNINLFTKGRGIHLEIPELPIEVASFIKRTPLTRPSYGDSLFNLNLKKKEERFLLTGEIFITNACFAGSFEHRRELRIPDFLVLDLKINFGEKFWLKTPQVNVRIEEGYILVKSDNGRILINGVIKSRHGNIDFLGNVFKIKYIEIEIKENKPYMGLVAMTNVEFKGERQTIEMRIEKAPLEMLKVKFINTKGEEIKPEKLFLEIAEHGKEITPEEKNLILREQLVKLISSSLTLPLAKAIIQHIPIIDGVRVARETKELQTTIGEEPISMIDLLKGSKYTFEKYLTDELSLGYSMVIGGLGSRLALKHQIEIAYRLRGNIYLIGAYELASREFVTTYIPERKIMIETHWRFGW